MTTQSASPSTESIWRKYDSAERRLSAPLSERMLDLAGVGAGMRLLDIATGRGEPAIPAAKRVSPNGTVLGIDADKSMLQLARERAAHEGVTNLELAVSNAEFLNGIQEAAFDVVLARWGLMYFQNPLEALHAARRSLKSGGLLVAAVWVEPARASFFELPRAVLSRLSPVAAINVDSPGTFYYANADRLSHDLESAGFIVEHSETIWVDVMEAASATELIAWARAFGMSRLLQDIALDIQESWEAQFVAAAELYRHSDGIVRLGGISKIVVASTHRAGAQR